MKNNCEKETKKRIFNSQNYPHTNCLTTVCRQAGRRVYCEVFLKKRVSLGNKGETKRDVVIRQ